MSLHELDVIERLHALAQDFEMPAAPPTDDLRRGRRRIRRRRAMMAVAAAVPVAFVLGATTALGLLDRETPDVLGPAEGSGTGMRGVPVWYDAKGLHRGDVVERTPVDILLPERPAGQGMVVPQKGALALVRSGALYLHHATGDVWFHPWVGEPRVVGRNSVAGPGGDPNGDTAAWFDGFELVVYDTAAGREISRTREIGAVRDRAGGDHYPAGNSFQQVSAERITWWDDVGQHHHDVRTGSTSAVEGTNGRHLIDVHGDVEILGERDTGLPIVRVPGHVEQRFPDLEGTVRLSPSGNYLLAPQSPGTGHDAAILDTRTGELWQVPKSGFPWIAWSYGDVALVDTEDALLACDAARRSCEDLEAERPFLLPTN